MLAGSKLGSIESKISEALINTEISHVDVMKTIKKKYLELKEIIRMMDSQRSDTEKINLIKEGKKEALLKPLNRMILLITVLSLKYKLMSCYCLKCRKKIQKL